MVRSIKDKKESLKPTGLSTGGLSPSGRAATRKSSGIAPSPSQTHHACGCPKEKLRLCKTHGRY